jgi:FkbM family methyltransferase
MKVFASVALNGIIRPIVGAAVSRRCLNMFYNRLGFRKRRLFWLAFAKAFRDKPSIGEGGIWRVEFCGKSILMPLRPDRMWLDWDSAVSIVGHDVDVKQTYSAILCSSLRPDVFVDVGGNYGTHSLLFLVHGVRTVTFEPNSSCHAYFHETCALNGVEPDLHGVALGDTEGSIKLVYPERHTWLGSTSSAASAHLLEEEDVKIREVPLRKLDDYLREINIGAVRGRILMKIDTEGNELSVLRGGEQFIDRAHPDIVFECWKNSERRALFEFLCQREYALYDLPWTPNVPHEQLDMERFSNSSAMNFFARQLTC